MTSTTKRRTLRIIALGLVLATATAAGYAAVSVLVADRLTRASNHPSRFVPAGLGAEAEPWSTRTGDGLTLRGYYLPTGTRRRLLILIHGMGGSWGEMAERGRDLHGRGYDVLLFDLRGHGRSDPSRLFMGRRERDDLRAVLAWATARGFPPERIGWLGQSMGASTLLMEAARNPRILAAVVDSPFGDLPALLRTQLTQHSGLPAFFNPGILLAARLAYGVRTDDLVPIRSAARWGARPLLLIHGEADSIVPVIQARLIARAAGPSCRSITLPGVEHVGAYREDPSGYVAAVDGFFDRNLLH